MNKDVRRILAIDTCTDVSSICLDGKSIVWRGNRNQSKDLLEKISGLVDENCAGYNSLSGIFVVNGPGSYTGIRIGVSVANTMAMIAGIPVRGGDSLLTQAYLGLELCSDKYQSVVSVIGAGGNRIYAGIYFVFGDGLQFGGEIFVGEVELFMKSFINDKERGDKILFVLEADEYIENYLKSCDCQDILNISNDFDKGRAWSGVKYFDSFDRPGNNVVIPLYLRGPVQN